MFLPLAFENLHVVLRTLFDKMLPLCSEMTAIASGIAGLGALLYISYRVWQSLARAEPIDVFPLLRPFALGLCILFFEPLVLGTINGILSPVVQGTHKLLVGQTFDMGKYQKDKQELMKATAEANFDQLATAQTGEETTAMLEEMNLEPADLMALQQMYEESSSWSLKGMITKAFHWLLELLFDCASLIIDTIRTFFLIVLAILGPLAFAVAVYDGFHASFFILPGLIAQRRHIDRMRRAVLFESDSLHAGHPRYGFYPYPDEIPFAVLIIARRTRHSSPQQDTIQTNPFHNVILLKEQSLRMHPNTDAFGPGRNMLLYRPAGSTRCRGMRHTGIGSILWRLARLRRRKMSYTSRSRPDRSAGSVPRSA